MGKSTTFLIAAVVSMLFGTVAARADIPIAVAGPLTGNVFRGEQMQQGAQMAVADLNAAGGVLGQRLRLIAGDDACDAGQAVALARKLVGDGVVFVAGHACSHASIPAAKIYQVAGVIMISPASTNPRLTDEGGDYIFRVCGRDDLQGRVAGDLLAERWADKRIAIIQDQTVYGEGLARLTRARLRERGIREALYLPYQPGQSDYSALVAKLRSAAIDVIYLGGYGAEAGLILRESREQGFAVQLVGGDSLTTEEFWIVAGPAGEGTLMSFGPDPRMNPEAAAVVARFRARGFEPAGYTLHTYGAVQAWAQAVEKAGSLDPGAVSAALRSHRFTTVLGTIDFDENGDITAPSFIWYAWRDGAYVPVD